MEVFLIILFFIGLVIASISDLIKREVDNYFNLFLGVAGFLFVVFFSIFNKNYYYLLMGLVAFGIMFIVGNFFYYSRTFGGGDSKLIMAMFPLFAAFSFYDTLANIGAFIIFLMVAGSIFGILYSVFLVVKNYSCFREEVKKGRGFSWWAVGFGVLLLVLSYFSWWFLFFAIMTFLFIFLFAFGTAIDKSCMVKSLKAGDLREGDWLVTSIRYKGRTVKPNWEGLTRKEVNFLRGYKKKIQVKDGIPFVPAFLIAFIFWIFRFQIVSFLMGLV